MKKHELIFPFPPSLNTYWRHNRGRTHISTEGKKYRNTVAMMCRIENIKTIEGNVKVKISAIRPDNRRRDLDNLLKVVLDAMQHGGIYKDDSQIVDLSIRWAIPVEFSPRLKVEVQAI